MKKTKTPAKPRTPRRRLNLPSYTRLLAFAEWCAQKEYEDPDVSELTSEDARAERNEMIEAAMRLMGRLSKCSACGELVPFIKGCPTGEEVCANCFEQGQG